MTPKLEYKQLAQSKQEMLIFIDLEGHEHMYNIPSEVTQAFELMAAKIKGLQELLDLVGIRE